METHWNKEYKESQFDPPYRGYQHPDQIDWARYGPDRPGKARGEVFSVLSILFTPEVGTGRMLPVKFWVGGSVDPSDRLLRSAVAGIVGHFVLPGSSPHPGHSLTGLGPLTHTSLGLSGGRVSGHNVLRLRHYRHHLQPGSVSSSPGSQHRGPHDRAGAAGGHGEAG